MMTAAKWGAANQHRAALGPGKNLLGKLLVEVREEIKAYNTCAAAVDVLQPEEQEQKLLSTLTTLDGLTAINVRILRRTRVALAVKPLRVHPRKRVAALATRLFSKWKALAREQLSAKEQPHL